MSYILDALNKSEKERAKKRRPGLTALRDEPEKPGFSIRNFLLVLLVLAILNSLGVWVFFGDRFTTTSLLPVAEPESPNSATKPATLPASDSLGSGGPGSQGAGSQGAGSQGVIPQTVSPEIAVAPQTAPSQNRALTGVTADKPVGQIIQTTTGAPIRRYEALPARIQAQLPTLTITTHIYASDAALRLVNIDGVNQQEGDLLANGLTLMEITETGIVLQSEETVYAVNIVDAWQATP